MSYFEPEKNEKNKSVRHSEVATKTNLSTTSRSPTKHQLVYSTVVLPQGTTRIFGILHNNKVYTKISALAPTGVMENKGFTLLSDRDYNIYNQWLKTPSKSKTRLDADRMHWTEVNAEKLISEGNEKESHRLFGQSEYERGQKLREQYQIPVSSLKTGDKLEFQFNKSIWTVTSIDENDDIYATEDATKYAPKYLGEKIIVGYKKL